MIFDYVIGDISKLMTLMNCVNFSDFSIICVARQVISNTQVYREEIIENSITETIAEEIIQDNPTERVLDNPQESTSQSSGESIGEKRIEGHNICIQSHKEENIFTNKLWYPEIKMLCKSRHNLGILGIHDEILEKIEQFMILPLYAKLDTIQRAYHAIDIKLTISVTSTRQIENTLIYVFNSRERWIGWTEKAKLLITNITVENNTIETEKEFRPIRLVVNTSDGKLVLKPGYITLRYINDYNIGYYELYDNIGLQLINIDYKFTEDDYSGFGHLTYEYECTVLIPVCYFANDQIAKFEQHAFSNSLSQGRII